jgi:hypothetical protein
MPKQRIATETLAVIVHWFCECGGEIRAMSNTGRIVPNPQYPRQPLMLYAHKCRNCGIEIEDREMFPLVTCSSEYSQPG